MTSQSALREPRAPRAILWAVCLGAVLLLHLSLLLVWKRPPPGAAIAPPAVLIDLAPPAPALTSPTPAPPVAMQKPTPVALPKVPPAAAAPANLPPPPVKPHLRVIHQTLRKIVPLPAKQPIPPAPNTPPSAMASPVTTAPAAHAAAAPPSGAVRQDWLAHVMAHIEQFKTYPTPALQHEWEGKTMLSFTIRRDGSLVSVTLTGSSGHEVLDAAALQTVHDASPLPPPPPSIPGTLITLTLPIGFSMTDR